MGVVIRHGDPSALRHVPAVPAREQVSRSAMWSILENGSLAALSFGMLVVFARFLSPADFGLFSVVLAVIEVLAVLCGMLFHDALVQRRTVESTHWDSAYTVSLLVGLALMVLCWLLAPWFATRVGLPQAGPLLACAAVSLPIGAAGTVLIAQQRRALEFRTLAIRSTTSRVTGAALGLSAVLLGYGVWGLAIQHLAMAVAGWVMLWWVVAYRPKLRVSSEATRSLLKAGAPNVAALLLVFATKRLFVIWSAAVLGPEIAGYLNLALRLVDVLWAIAATAINQVSLPVMSRLQDHAAEQVEAYRKAAQLCGLLLFSVFTTLAMAAPELVTLLFGERWLPSAAAVTALALLVGLQLPNLMAQTLLKAKGHAMGVMVASVGELLTMVVLFALVFHSGIALVRPGPNEGVIAVLCIWAVKEALLWCALAGLMSRTLALRWTAQVTPFGWAIGFGALACAAALAVRTSLPDGWSPVVRLACVVAVAMVSFWGTAMVVKPAQLRDLRVRAMEAVGARHGSASTP